MNLLLRPLEDTNDVYLECDHLSDNTLDRSFLCYRYILGIDERHKIMGAMTPPSRKSCYNFRVTEINRVVDGDTIDVTIDLGFDLL